MRSDTEQFAQFVLSVHQLVQEPYFPAADQSGYGTLQLTSIPYETRMWANTERDGLVALPNIGGALCSKPQSLADAHY